MYTYEDIFTDKQTVLFVTAHPDDVDVFFGGILCKLSKDKKNTPILILTSGGRGSQENVISESQLSEIRATEEKNALSILGVGSEKLEILNYLDGEIDNSLEIISKISYAIRKEKPQLVCTLEPHGYYYHYVNSVNYYVNHRDHRNTGTSVLDAIYPFSRDRSFFTEQLDKDVKTHAVYEVLLTSDYVTNTKVDISDVVNLKREALLTHSSQFDRSTVEEIINEGKDGKKYFEKFNYLKLAW